MSEHSLALHWEGGAGRAGLEMHSQMKSWGTRSAVSLEHSGFILLSESLS